ncbi:MAG: alpha/beta hydrolase [Chitinophagaceae bacterium]
MPYFEHNELLFHYIQTAQGKPFIFQHGLGGSVDQIIKIYSPPAGVKLVSCDFRAHGKTATGWSDQLNFNTFADDIVALMDHLHLDQAIVGGISMGAAVALNFVLRYPALASGLILVRPAWLDGPMEKKFNEIFKLIAQLVREYGLEAGRQLFMHADIYIQLFKESPGTAQSFLGQFNDERLAETAVKFERLPDDSPSKNREEWKSLTTPTLILANRSDPVHPFEYGLEYSSAISRAEFREITPKSISEEQHNKDVQKNIDLFITSLL